MQTLVHLCVEYICVKVVPSLSPPQTLNLPADLATLVLDYLRIQGFLEVWHLNLFKDIPLTHLSLSTPKQSRYTPVTDEWLQLIAHHSNLVYLELSECYKVSNSIVAKLLTGLPNLRHLNLEKCRRISDNGLTSLSRLTNLEFLDVSGTQISDKTVCEQISFLHSLTSLGLSGSGATDKAVAGLQSLTNLRYLAMGSSSIGNEACHLISEHTQLTSLLLPFSSIGVELAWFTSLRNLTELDVSLNAHIDDTVISSISAMTGITSLDLSRTEVTDVGVSHLRGFTNLAFLNLGFLNISDVACNYISGFKLLTSLQVKYCTRITDAGVLRFKELPELMLLNISFCSEITDTGMVHLACCTQLRSLNIGSKRITNRGILSLTALTNLTTLLMWETSADYASIIPLSAALPSLPALDERMNTNSGTYLFQAS